MGTSTILIVDDEAEGLKLLTIELTTEGFTVLKAQTGQQAIEKARNFLPNVILMDLLLPDMNGAEAVKILKSDPKTKDIPVIFISAIITRQAEYLKQPNVTVDDVHYPAIAKPFNPKELLTEINKAINRLDKPHYQTG